MSDHWNAVYESKGEAERSWTESSPVESLRIIDRLALEPMTGVLDVGGGASRLVDELIARGFLDVSVLDVSAVALAEARRRVGESAATWIDASILDWSPERRYGLWHDRAVLHFLTDPDDQARYADLASTAVQAGGYLVIGTFSTNGPTHCSGLPVTRWSAEGLTALFSRRFDCVDAFEREHRTPWDSSQEFLWTVFRRR